MVIGSIVWAIVFLIVVFSIVRATAVHNRRKLELRASERQTADNQRALEAASAEHDREVVRLERKNAAELEALLLPETAKVKRQELAQQAAALELESQSASERTELERRTAAAVEEAVLQQRVAAELEVIAAQKAARIKYADELVLAEIALANRRSDFEAITAAYSQYVAHEKEAYKAQATALQNVGLSTPKFNVPSFEKWAGKRFGTSQS
jgi:hypothetical protein